MTDVRVKQLEPSDAGVAGVVLAASHHNYPAFRLQLVLSA
jgi:hypothetical protein